MGGDSNSEGLLEKTLRTPSCERLRNRGSGGIVTISCLSLVAGNVQSSPKFSDVIHYPKYLAVLMATGLVKDFYHLGIRMMFS